MTSEDHPERLVIALEPEVASIYVRKLRLYQLVPDNFVTQTLGRSNSASTRANRYSYLPDNSATGTPLPCYGCDITPRGGEETFRNQKTDEFTSVWDPNRCKLGPNRCKLGVRCATCSQLQLVAVAEGSL